jgi:hypothetical protein
LPRNRHRRRADGGSCLRTVLKCLDREGKIEYRSSPCPADAQQDLVVAKKSTRETSTVDANAGEASASQTSAATPVRRRTNISQERRQALDVAERYAAVARAARPQVQVQVLPPPAGK